MQFDSALVQPMAMDSLAALGQLSSTFSHSLRVVCLPLHSAFVAFLTSRARDALAEAIAARQNGFGLDAAAVCLTDALQALFDLTGENASDATIEEVFETCCVGKKVKNDGAFSPWGRRCPRPRPRTDEGRACGGCPLKGRLRELRPHQPPAGGSFPRGGSL